MNNLIWVTFQREGVHCYPEAGLRPDLADVSFLGTPHRHIFFVKVWIEVLHDNRDIEFLQFKRWLEKSVDDGFLSLNHKSCEMICDDIAKMIINRYPGRFIRISVSEDNENGAEKEYPVV